MLVLVRPGKRWATPFRTKTRASIEHSAIVRSVEALCLGMPVAG